MKFASQQTLILDFHWNNIAGILKKMLTDHEMTAIKCHDACNEI